MSDVTRILSEIEQGDDSASEQLLPRVYEELWKLAVATVAQEASGQPLQATALVHEAYLRLVDGDEAQHWQTQAAFRLRDRVAPEPEFLPNAKTRRPSEGRVP